MSIAKVLTIAGSDCSGGAGIQADIKTMTAHKCYGMSVITAITCQNTIKVYDVLDIPQHIIEGQLNAVFNDIFPDAVKIGMVSCPSTIKIIIATLRRYQPRNLVIDPVMISTSGSKLLCDEALEILITELLPMADLITPNLHEAELLSGIRIKNRDEMLTAAQIIASRNIKAVLIKGGHLLNSADDLLFTNGKATWYDNKRIDNPNTHGTGCTLSSAIACNLAQQNDLITSVRNAKNYVTGAIESGLNLGNGSGPLEHTYSIK